MDVRVLGVDPGTVVTGWAVVECEGSSLARIASGTIRLGRGDLAQRLARVYAELAAIIAGHRPRILSLERNFVARNVQSAFRLGEARGVAMAAAAADDVELSEYTPATIKKSVVGHGRAAKSDVQAAVVRIFALDEMPAEDEADALAVAACHGLRRGFEERVATALGDETCARTSAPRVRRRVTG